MMVFRVHPKRIFADLVVASAVALYAPAPFAGERPAEAFATQAASTSKPTLDYEFFKTRIEPIFLKNRSVDHVRCYACHQVSRHGGGPLSLEQLPPGKTFWTEEQSRHNFETVSKVVVPGAPQTSMILIMTLAPEAGGLADTHQGGRQFASKDDPDYKIIEAWIRGEKAGGSSAP
jgi:hypothetical protein